MFRGFKDVQNILETEHYSLVKATQEVDGKRYILKVSKIAYSGKIDPTFDQEMKLMMQFPTDVILKPIGLHTSDQKSILVMENFNGLPLRQIISKPRSISQSIKLLCQIALAIEELHQKKWIHCNLTPENIWADEETGKIKILDFSLATLINKTQENASGFLGTYAYMSPEQTGRMNRSVDRRSDLYSLGVIFYEILTGQLPFQASQPMEWVHCHIAKVPPSLRGLNPKIPSYCEAVVLKLLSKNQEDRYDTATSLCHALENKQSLYKEFRIPRKLYGREHEVEKLLSTFEAAVTTGEPQVLLISGYSGVGKSALVSEVHKPIASKKGYFISGKFDQYKQNTPYYALIQSYQDLVRQILTEDIDRVQEWKKKLQYALGRNGQVVVNVIPELELIIGKQPALARLDTNEAENRFRLVFTDFQKVLGQKEHPIIMFLDDLQWVDSPSMKMIQEFVGQANVKYFFLIGAYRDNEVDSTHKLTVAIEQIRKNKVPVNQIFLEPLDLKHVNQIVCETIGTSSADTTLPLSQLVFDKTKGNPFFFNQMLTSFHERNFVWFDAKAEAWTWDIKQIKAENISDNVVQFMTEKILMLSRATQDTLRLAACVGNTFELKTLKTVSDTPIEILLQTLKEAIHEGYIVSLSEISNLDPHDDEALRAIHLRFSHDRIQQAAYQLTPEIDRKAMHAKIGRLLLERTKTEHLNDILFDVVNHLNIADYPEKISDRIHLAELNLRAGTKAKLSSAYESALRYLKTGIELLPSESLWPEFYSLVYNLHLETAEVMSAVSNFKEAEQLFQKAVECANSAYDKGIAYDKYSIFLQSTGRAYDGLLVTKKALGLFGILFPATPEESAKEVATLMEELGHPQVLEQFMKLPKASAEHILIDRLYDRCNVATYFAQPADLTLVISKNVKHVLDCGITPESGLAIGWFAMLLGMMEKKELSFKYGDVGIKIMSQFDDPYFKGKTDMITNGQALCWRDSFTLGEKKLNDSFDLCHSTGEMQYASYARIISYIATIAQSSDCRHVLSSCQFWHDYCDKYVPLELGQAKIRLYLLKGLMGLPHEEVDAEAIIAQYQADKNATDVVESLVELARISTLMGDYKSGYNYFVRAEPIMVAGGAGNLLLVMLFYHGYAICCARMYEASGDVKYLEQLESYLKRLQSWATLNPDNFYSYYKLVEAEKERALGHHSEAARNYLKAIIHAHEHEYTLLEAYGHEYLAQMYQKTGHPAARIHFEDAQQAYQRCHAKAKVEQIEKILSTLHQEDVRAVSAGSKSSGLSLDTEIILKSSEMLSSTIVLDDLIRKALAISMESAGAQRAVFIVKGNHGLQVEAEADLTCTKRIESLPISSFSEIPQTIINYVMHTEKTCILGDAGQGDYKLDPYIQKVQAKSILCMPLIRQKRLIGLLYLENNIASDVFLEERIQLLVLLSTQIAISLENARFYDDLETKVKARTDELEKQRSKIVNASKLEMLAQMAGGVAHEINTPLAAISLCVETLIENTETPSMEPDKVKDFLSKITKSTEKIEKIVSSLLFFSRSNKAAQNLTDVNEVIDETMRMCKEKFSQNEIIIKSNRPVENAIADFDKQHIMRVFMSLAQNSFDSILENSEANPSAEKWIQFDVSEKDWFYEIRVTDSGKKPESQVQEKMFEPFFTTKDIGKGSGLGLCVAKGIMQEHLGEIFFDPSSAQTCFVLHVQKAKTRAAA
jgi:predicted ATPase/signal transduction histidine kinase